MATTKLSVVIVTKNRARDLAGCLRSLKRQSVPPDELVVIDNGSTDQTVAVIWSFRSTASYPVRVITETGHGYPVIYNRGLKEATYTWTAFIDDDCIAARTWVYSIKTSIQKHPRAASIMGLSETVHPHNPYSFVTFILNYLWKENGSVGEKIISGEIMDNKNIVYNTSFLRKHKLQFDVKRVMYLNGASEDCDLGDKIITSGGLCFYDKRILVAHKDPMSHHDFVRKFLRSYQGYLQYKKDTQRGIDNPKHVRMIRLRSLLPWAMRQNNLSWIQQIFVIFVLCEAVVFLYMLRMQASMRQLFQKKTFKRLH